MVTHKDVAAAAKRIEPFVHRTPVLTCAALDARVGCRVWLKCEHLQRVGAFKMRGAANALALLDPAVRKRGVITHSSGNHAQAVARAAAMFGVPAVVVMPRNAPRLKREATEGYGARVVLCEPTMQAREAQAQALMRDEGLTLIHPYNDDAVIAGQGTAAIELLEDVGPLDAMLVPISGGGLTAGTAVAASGCSPPARVFAVEPCGADDAFRSMQAGTLQPLDHADTIADGLRATLGDRPFAVMRACDVEVVTVTDARTLEAMRFVWERTKQLIEPSAAVAVAGLLHPLRERLRGQRVGVILSGGNTDLGPMFPG